MNGGVSVVICCYNSAARLPETLARLRTQRVADAISWEVVVVDNASSDDTAEAARQHWGNNDRVPLSVITEKRRGVAYAREAGFDAARYEYVSFIDDDNWVCEHWVARVEQVMAEHPEVGACGGYGEPLCDGAMPRWFHQYRQYYAIGPERPTDGTPPDTLWFAGMTVRAKAWRELRRGGFRFLTVSAAEDNEISLALRLAGWKLWLDEDLRLTHVLPAARLTWPYFCELQRARFASMVAVDPYRLAIDRRETTNSTGSAGSAWSGQMALTLKALLQNLIRHPLKVLRPQAFEGDEDVFRIELYRGRLLGLIKYRREYDANVSAIGNASWRRNGPALHA
jgi:glycosyltransferase involved in cell wall biosynthesis